MKLLKSISTAVMLITGIITAITGAVETVIKLVDKLHPVPLPSAPMAIEKSLRGLPEYIAVVPAPTFWIEWHGPLLWVFGLIAIFTAIWISSKNNP